VAIKAATKVVTPVAILVETPEVIPAVGINSPVKELLISHT